MGEPINVYVAGSSGEMIRAAHAIEFVKSTQGLHLTFDWVEAIRTRGAPGRSSSYIGRKDDPEMRLNAEADFVGVRQAEVFWLLWPSTVSTGAWAEFGMALMAKRILGGRQVFVSRPLHRLHSKYHIFLECDGIKFFETDAEAGSAIARMVDATRP
jgi:hypothetical protein